MPRQSSRRPGAPLRWVWPCAAVLAASLTGCPGSETPPPPPPPRPAQPAAATPAPPPPSAQPAPRLPVASSYGYEARGRRDPFRPLIVPKVAAITKRVRPGLPGLRVNELKLAGIMWGQRGFYALVEAPDGKGYVLRVNDLVGEDAEENARVSKITPEAVMFEVKGAVQMPEARVRLVELRLRKEE